MIPEIHKAPIEGDRKVVMLRDADRMEPTVGNTLLKSIEEPPPRTVVMLLTDRPEGLLATIRSRCQRVDFAYAPPVRSAATTALQAVFASTVARVDGRAANDRRLGRGTGSRAGGRRRTAWEVAAAAELEELDAQIEQRGYPAADRGRAAQAVGRPAEARAAPGQDRRADPGHRRDRAGLPRRARGHARRCRSISPSRADAALDACREARQADEFNPNVGTLLLRLISHLPAVG